ncbi:MAG: nickel-dependent lactate racemase [Actinobacteria bacterium]|jgi:nickel-dependent lactate racemase|nr:MAG: nickel-dependent lactate racemase [Actinomycetota bacterium]
MKFTWGFGRGEQGFEVPDPLHLGTVEGVAVEPLPDLEEAFEEAMADPIGSPPLAELVQPGDSVAIACPDYHRLWVQSRRWLPLVVRALNRAGIPDRDITVIIANGTHGAPDYPGIKAIVGDDFPHDIRIINHDCRDPSMLRYLGKTPHGTPVWVNRYAMEADHIILTGAVVPHTFAGYGGGRKAVLPGMSGLATILANHRRALSETPGGGTNPMARPGVLAGNPVHEDMLAAARLLGPRFIINFALSEEGDFLGVFAGDLARAHERGCAFVSEAFRVEIPARGDIVVASRGGFPMDLTFYQAFQSNANARAALREDGEGVLIMVGECTDGLGPYEFHRWFDLGGADEIEAELRSNFTVAGFVVFRAALLYRQAKKVMLVSSLDPEVVSRIGIIPHASIAGALREAMDTVPGGRVLLMPHASQTIPDPAC